MSDFLAKVLLIAGLVIGFLLIFYGAIGLSILFLNG